MRGKDRPSLKAFITEPLTLMLQKEDMENKILEYIREHDEPLDSEEAILAWWQGLQEMTSSLDDLTEQLEYLEDQAAIEKLKIEKDFFIYRLIDGK